MSKPQDGAEPPPGAPARSKRTRRGPKHGNPNSVPAPADGAAGSPVPVEGGPARHLANGERKHSASNEYGSPAIADEQPGATRKRRHRRKRQKRAVQQNGGTLPDQAIRNLRPAIVPVPDARYVPPENGARDKTNGSGAGQPASRRRHEVRHRGSADVFAALDLGTNNCRLLIAVPTHHRRIRVVDAFSRIVRLGEGMAASTRLDEDAMDRAIEALRICAAKLSNYRIAGKRMIATEACRRASNGTDFLERVRRETGLRLEIVDRETEARLAAEGCGELMDRHAEGAVMFDIGGGSSELILVNRNLSRSRRISRQIAGWTSLPLGVVTLAERHGGRSVSAHSFEAMVGEVMEHLDAFEGRTGLADIWAPGRTHLLGTSGTVTTIAGVHLDLPRYDRRRVDGIWLSDGQIDKVIADLLAMDYESRARNPCIGRERADLVLAGCAILEAIRKTWPSDRLRVADRGLREGILAELMHHAGIWDRRRYRSTGATGGRK